MTISLRAGLLAVVTSLAAMPAQAGYLYWSKFPVKTGTEAKCMQLAYGVAGQNGLQGIRRSGLEIAGSKGGVYIAITCVARGSGQHAIAVVMAMGDNGPATSGLRDLIADKLSKTQFID